MARFDHWRQDMLNALDELRRTRPAMPFSTAWVLTIRKHPLWPMGLRDSDDLVVFFRRACDDAWHDRPGAVRDLA